MTAILGRAEIVQRTDINPALIYWKEFLIHRDIDNEALTKNIHKAKIDQEYSDMVREYEETFKRLAKVRLMKANCDWGDDLSEGPSIMLPYLAHAKHLGLAARLRVRFHLEHNHQEQAVEDLSAAFLLARHTGSAPFLINVLVEYAMNKSTVTAVAENFHRFTPEALKELKHRLNVLPAGFSISDIIPTEKDYMAGWAERQIHKIKKQHGGGDKGANAVRELMNEFAGNSFGDQLISAGDGTVDGVIKLIQATYPFYDEAGQLYQLPPEQFFSKMATFNKRMEQSNNPVLATLFPALDTSRMREIGNQVLWAMLHTAIEYRLNGSEGLNKVKDPIGENPFSISRYKYEGVDRGIILESQFQDESMNRQIFLEKTGKQFHLSGKNIGAPVLR